MAEYIEREAVIDLITRRYENPEICAQEINSIPTADVAPVVHGRWEPIINAYGDLEGWICACGRESKELSKYCPNCGAKMDGGARRCG